MGSGNIYKLLESRHGWRPSTVINVDSHAVVGNVIDLTNKTPSTGIIHFGKVSKLSYNGGRSHSRR